MPQRSLEPSAVLYCAPDGWSIELAAGWSAEARVVWSGRDVDRHAAFEPPGRDALLRITRTSPSWSDLSAEDWVDSVGQINRAMRRPVGRVRRGVFTGYRTSFATDDRAFRGWALRAGTLALDATYICPLDLAGRDDAAVDAMLATLYLRGVAPAGRR